MSPVPGREALEAMKRVDIQKLCKDYGVKANLKTEALIDLLLDASQPQRLRPNPVQPPQRPPSTTTRIPSLAGARLRGQSSSSVIIHGSDDEAEESSHQQPLQVQPERPPFPQPPRTRKAKQTQYRLGVGRPIIAGGSGPRAVTKSASVSRTVKRAKSSRTIQPTEATITEEPEPEGNTDQCSSDPKKSLPQPDALPKAGPSSRPIEIVIAEALAPVQQELDSHKTQLTDLTQKVSSMIESFEAKIRNLTSEIGSLRAQARNPPADSHDSSLAALVQDHPVRIPIPPSTPKRVRSPYRPTFALPNTEKPGASELSSDSSIPDILIPSDSQSNNNTEQLGEPGPLLPGFPHSTLGKRPRDSSGNSTGIFELGQEEKLTDEELESKFSYLFRTGRRPSTSRFERLPNFYGPTSPPLLNPPATSSANNAENQNPFSFNFLPLASTPAQAVYPLTMGTFPYPEPPTSPSPAVNPDRPGSRHSDRLGGFGPPRSSSRGSGRATSGGSQTRGEASGSGHQWLSKALLPLLQNVPMYGTELEGDTRFGDFGVEGVASGFWAGGRF
ncbi:hypothetical protein BU15DRAFT_61221 [Melanogaster broomeanus]|nr:hypothetical protein BU15DRAFT_61221 [Melanogaster broomeanus]